MYELNINRFVEEFKEEVRVAYHVSDDKRGFISELIELGFDKKYLRGIIKGGK